MGEAFFRVLEITPDEKFINDFSKLTTTFHKVVYIIAYQMAKNDGDAYIICSGDNSTGKSSFDIRFMKRLSKTLKTFFNITTPFKLNRNVLYNPKKNDINELQADKEFQLYVVDEGYLVGMNLDFSLEAAKETVKVAMGTRSKHNAVIFNFQKPTRATKGLLERFKIMFFKPTKRDAILLARSNLTVLSEDPWDLDNILKAKTDRERITAIKRNQNYIVAFTTKKLPDKIYDKYKGYQREALDARRQEKIAVDDIDSSFIKLSKDIYKRVKEGSLAYASIGKEFERIFGNETQAKSMRKFYEKWEMKEKISDLTKNKGIDKRQARKEAQAELDEIILTDDKKVDVV